MDWRALDPDWRHGDRLREGSPVAQCGALSKYRATRVENTQNHNPDIQQKGTLSLTHTHIHTQLETTKILEIYIPPFNKNTVEMNSSKMLFPSEDEEPSGRTVKTEGCVKSGYLMPRVTGT